MQAQSEAAAICAPQQPVIFKSGCQSVCGRSTDSGSLHQHRERTWAIAYCVENRNRLVEHTDCA
jgi:hypothetical protein